MLRFTAVAVTMILVFGALAAVGVEIPFVGSIGPRVSSSGLLGVASLAFDIEPMVAEGGEWTYADARPSARSRQAMAYDSQSDRIVLFGGWTGANNDETWAYDFDANSWTRMEPSPISPSEPRNLQATPGDGRVDLTWQAPASDGGSPITNYKIYRGTSSGSLTLLTTVGNVLTYTDTGLTNGVTYYYQVSAVNAVGEGPKSNEVSATPTAPTDSIPPVIAIGSPANNSVLTSTTVTVTGTASDNVAKVELSTDGATWTLASGTTSWSGSVTLQAGTNVIYARATDTAGNRVTVRITVTVQTAGPSPQGLDPTVFAGILVAIAAAIVVGGTVAVVRSRRRRMMRPRSPPPSSPPR